MKRHLEVSRRTRKRRRELEDQQTEKDLKVFKPYGNGSVPQVEIREFNAIESFEKGNDGFEKFGIKVEHFTVHDYRFKRGVYSLSYDKRYQAVYLLWESKEIVYVGETFRENPYDRQNEHHTCERSPKVYDSVTILHLPNNVCRKTLESLFIFKHKPKYNSTYFKAVVPKSQLKKITTRKNSFNIKIN